MRDDLARPGRVGRLRGRSGAWFGPAGDVGRARARRADPDENLPLAARHLLDIDQLLDDLVQLCSADLELALERAGGEPRLLREDLAGALQSSDEAHGEVSCASRSVCAVAPISV